ncbi:MAG: cell division protein FtsA [Lentisphaeria bacterium]|nr:cell division protein FtsA [Lentisphaeria bacterium]
MARKPKRNILTGIEIGTSTIKVVMGEFQRDDVLAIVGTGQAPSLHVQKGEILDADKVLSQLARAVNAAESTSGLVIDGPIFLATTGAHIRSVVAVGRTMIQGAGRTVSDDDIVTAVQGARSYGLPPDQQVIHTCERCFQVDDGIRLQSANGRVGDWLAAEVLLIVGQHQPLETACALVHELMNARAKDIAFSAVADCFAAFGPGDAEQGQLLVDIGAGVTEYAVFQGNGCFHAGQITVGCDHLANDLAIGLHLSPARGKALVRELAGHGCSALVRRDGRDRTVDIRTGAGTCREVPCVSLEEIAQLRLGELFQAIREDLLRNHALGCVGGRVKLCGGGALIPGITQLAHKILGLPADVIKPRLLSGQEDILNAPHYMTPVGLIRWGRFVQDIEGSGHAASLGGQLWQEFRRLLRLTRESFRL